VRLALAFRQRFAKDVVVDLTCYRRYGHNETDEPAFTQPDMYRRINARRSVRKLYTESLIARGDITLDEAEVALEDYRRRLEEAFAETHEESTPAPAWEPHEHLTRSGARVVTAVPHERLERVIDALTTWPSDFHVHPKLERLVRGHRTAYEENRIDWALAESLAFGTLVADGIGVRIAGQDTRRGTFSQRHAVLVDVETEAEYYPLKHVSTDQAPFMVYDSVLSEYAALGFEYGYSVADKDTLVCWEAQFGDFANVGQAIVDQFIVAAEDKWGQTSGLTMLLPHGFEGQGPEHSSARIERFLMLCAEDNIRVAYPSTAAQYFHLLRRQVLDPERKPLVVFTPKRYLRMKASTSSLAALTDGGFHETLPDPNPPADEAVRRLILCTGKFAHELIARRDELGAPAVVLRVEQLYPVPQDEIVAQLARYPNLGSVRWAQEEPENMGPAVFAMLRALLFRGEGIDVGWVARPASASPASGSHEVHVGVLGRLLEAAFAGV
jgi:2-oxoglutarate dehydrogenase complex dehydrogenase (E1) component-like enzyme